jgi:hypothetical protein
MIECHRTLDPNITKNEIDLIADREGYSRFLPYEFIKHLAYSFSFYLVDQSPGNCICVNTEYTKEFRQLISLIDYSAVKTKNPIVFAIRVLSLMHGRVNLRKLNNSAQIGTSFKVEDVEIYSNYVFDLTSLTPEQFESLGIIDEDTDTIELTEDTEKLLKFYNTLSLMKNPSETKYDIQKEQIKSYSDFHHVRRYKFGLPTFGIDLGLKRLDITKIRDVETTVSEAVIVFDVSISMSKQKNALTLFRSVILYYMKYLSLHPDLVINIIFIAGSVQCCYRLTTVKELQELFSQKIQWVLPSSPQDLLFDLINYTYPGKPVVYITDGLSALEKMIKLKFQLHCITLFPNEMLKQMSLISGGQFIILQ